MNTLNDFLLYSGISIVFILIGFVIDAWLSNIGAIRSSRPAIIIGTILLVFLKPFLFRDTSWWFYSVSILLGLIFVVHRNDLRETMKKGRWWWLSEKKKTRKKTLS